MRHLTIPEPKDVIRGELAVPGDWVVAFRVRRRSEAGPSVEAVTRRRRSWLGGDFQ